MPLSKSPSARPSGHRRKRRRSPLGANLRRARRKAGLTQLALAHKSGYKGKDAGAHICRIEAGQQMPQLETLVRISKALGITLDTLLG